MIKPFFISLFFIISLNGYEIIENQNYFAIKIKDTPFKNLYINLKDEINFNSYITVHELNLAKSTENIAKALKEKAVLSKGINILICKSSLTLQMHKENIHNMTFCPMVISIYEYKKNRYISFKKYHPLKKGDKIASRINKNLKNLILKSLD